MLKSEKGFKLITLLKCTFQGMKKTPARTIPNSSYSNTRELFHTGPVIDQSGKILSFFRTQQLNPVPMFRTAKIAKNHGRIVKSRGVNFGPGIFAGFDNCSHAIIPVTKNPEYPPPPPPPVQSWVFGKGKWISVRDLARGIREEATLTTLTSLSNACRVLG